MLDHPNKDVALLPYRLDDRYTAREGRVLMTGTQALVRILLDQARRDREAGLNIAGFVSGYRGSPLGAVDQELWRAKKHLAAQNIDFLPAVNEDLAATAVLGTQQVESNPDRAVDGVFALWYGKGPGVDRAGDALKHGNAYGSSPHGGVLVVAGDDHGCVSSSMPHQSDVAFLAYFMPVLNPASVAEYLSFAEYGYALSRFSGTWVGFKAISETVESGTSFDLPKDRAFTYPELPPIPGGLHYRWPDLPGPQVETRMAAKKRAVYAFARANPIDKRIYDLPDATYGIVTTGKGHLDLLEALRLLGLDEAACRRLGIDIYKVGMVWPLALQDALEFVRGKREILVVEEKRGIIESQFKENFYDYPGAKPDCMVGKHDEKGQSLIPWTGELSPRLLAPIIAKRLDAIFPGLELSARAAALAADPARIVQVSGTTRTPYFCSGCPHNTSTKVPEGSKALSGIGCHVMATWMDRETSSLIQMGGEGVNWAAASRFLKKKHVFQNLGDGTFYHSGSLAIRQAIAAKASITYKILYNDAVAMTGGQPVDGPISAQSIAHSVYAEGVRRIALVSDTPDAFARGDFPSGVSIHHRSELDAVQRELREIEGVTVLIYAQTCATEKRRRRKRGMLEDPQRFPFINDLVCEGCGDCSVQSNCLSIEPKETPLGRKRKVNLSTCNKDFSCIEGFCPSFVTIEGGTRRKPKTAAFNCVETAKTLPLPALPSLENPFDLLVTGVGGAGVITVGAVLAMAAHLEGRGISVLDFTGFAQKFGPVMSYLRFGQTPDALHQVRIDHGAAHAMIGCDLVVSSSPKASTVYRKGMKAVLNTAQMPTGDVVRKRDTELGAPERIAAINTAIGAQNLALIDANRLAETNMGDAVYANMIMFGAAWQNGLVPVSLDAIDRSIDLNGVEVERNRQAFALGRLAAHDPALAVAPEPVPETLDALMARHILFLTQYQNADWAKRYQSTLQRLRESKGADEALVRVAARSLFKLMSYKDEYEVARLHLDPAFAQDIARHFEGDYTIRYSLAPPILPLQKDHRGRPIKRSFGPWMRHAFRLLAPLKTLRGTPFDLFGYQHERREERALIGWYEAVLDHIIRLLPENGAHALLPLAAAPLEMRGFGPVKAEAIMRIKAEIARILEALSKPEAACPPAALAAE